MQCPTTYNISLYDANQNNIFQNVCGYESQLHCALFGSYGKALVWLFAPFQILLVCIYTSSEGPHKGYFWFSPEQAGQVWIRPVFPPRGLTVLRKVLE